MKAMYDEDLDELIDNKTGVPIKDVSDKVDKKFLADRRRISFSLEHFAFVIGETKSRAEMYDVLVETVKRCNAYRRLILRHYIAKSRKAAFENERLNIISQEQCSLIETKILQSIGAVKVKNKE